MHQFIDIAVTGDGRSATLTMAGDLDAVSAPGLHDALRCVLTGGSPAAVILRLTAVTFIDSAGIHALLGAHRTAAEAGSRLVLRDPAPQVVRILAITGLLDHFGLTAGPAATGRSTRPAGRAEIADELFSRSARLRVAARMTRARARAVITAHTFRDTPTPRTPR